MTPFQYIAISDMILDIRRNPHNHPSESYRESFASYTPEQIEGTAKELERILETNDGRRAFSAIGAARERCTAAVCGLFIDGKL